MYLRFPCILAALLAAAPAAHATDIPIVGHKLVVVDKMAAAGKAKVVFSAKDPGIAKGPGTDPAQIEAALGVAYDGVSGIFAMWQGYRWQTSASIAKYTNRTAPSFGGVDLSAIAPGSLKVVGRNLGETPLDISTPPTGAVYVADTILNAGDTTRLCTQFTGCLHRVIGGGAAYKLVCRGIASTGDPSCTAAVPPPGSMFVDQGLTVLDDRTGLEWEKKTTSPGSGINAADLHDVDNTYRWAGRCSVATAKRCQPNAAADSACKAQTPSASWGDGCEQCSGAEGTCQVAPAAIATAWGWLSQLNAANFAGHSDWRLPSEDGRHVNAQTDPRELESILLTPYPCGTNPCLDPIFEPTASGYWSSTQSSSFASHAIVVSFYDGLVIGIDKNTDVPVRAVRDAF